MRKEKSGLRQLLTRSSGTHHSGKAEQLVPKQHICPYCGGKISRLNSFEDIVSTTCKPCFRMVQNERYTPLVNYLRVGESDVYLKNLTASDSSYVDFWKRNYGLSDIQCKNTYYVFNIEKLKQAILEIPNVQYTIDYRESDREHACSQVFAFICDHDKLDAPYQVCPWCNNYIPDDFWDMPLFTIILAGGFSVGKTTYLLSLLGDNAEAFCGQSDHLSISEISGFTNQYEDNFRKIISQWETSGIMPEQTRTACPPLGYKLTWRGRGQEKFQHLLYIMDTVGEDWSSTEKQGRFLSVCDGIILFCSDEQATKIVTREMHSDEEVNPIVVREEDDDNCNIEQNSSQNNEPPKSEEHSARRGTAYDTFNAIRSNNILPEQKFCAYVLTKIDRSLSQFSHTTSDIPYMDYLSVEKKYDSRIRSEILDHEGVYYRSQAVAAIFQKLFGRPRVQFREHCYFGIAATSKEGKVFPLGDKQYWGIPNRDEAFPVNVHEPIIWMLNRIIDKYNEG